MSFRALTRNLTKYAENEIAAQSLPLPKRLRAGRAAMTEDFYSVQIVSTCKNY
jgi:hypothetical protein